MKRKRKGKSSKRNSAARRLPRHGPAVRSAAKQPPARRRSDRAYGSLRALQLIYDTAPVGLAVLSTDCRYVEINQRLTEICGIPVADHIGRSVRETVPQVAEQVEKIVAAVIRSGRPVTGVEVRGQRADRRNADHVWITHWHPLKGERGRILGVNVVAEDVTERKRAEEKLARNERALRELNETLERRVEAETRERLQIWNVSQDLLVVGDLEGRILSVNPAWTTTLGWSQAELVGRTAEWLQHPEDRETTEAGLLRPADRGRTLSFEGRLRRKDGSYRWLSWTAVPDRDRIYAMARDITELKAAARSLRETRRELALVGRRTMVAAMTASIAHEIKQPLGAIVANAHAGLRWLTQSPPAIDEALETFRDIVADGYRTSEIIQSVRNMFEGREQPGEPIDANAIIRDTVAILRGELEAAGIAAQLDLAPQLPLVSARRGQVQQVILNLLTNAADAMRAVTDRKRVLIVRSETVAPDGIAVSVRDSGTGIDAKHAARIFDAFYTTKSQGMGMGLSICKSIVEAHGGRLSVSSAAPEGATFRFVLPGGRRGEREAAAWP
jgi:PAS domain S-box-containing protein